MKSYWRWDGIGGWGRGWTGQKKEWEAWDLTQDDERREEEKEQQEGENERNGESRATGGGLRGQMKNWRASKCRTAEWGE